jgi:hypothetical protein
MQLEVNGAPDTIVAKFMGKSMGIIGKAREPALEIFPEFEYMADEIMVFLSVFYHPQFILIRNQITFIYVEKTRKS